mmetsp:Transcript_14964/g.35941  ORF Transcript_14964/g.35941 Transcript_14964/m.35941 type:complete len:605 (-) Transcript_14964:147-1961(-)
MAGRHDDEKQGESASIRPTPANPSDKLFLMNKTELDPLIPPASLVYHQAESSSLRERRSGKTPSPPDNRNNNSMHYPQHADLDDGIAAVATRSPSRQLFYRDRIPSQNIPIPPSETRDFNSRTTPHVPVTVTDSSDSTVSSEPYDPSMMGGLGGPPQPQGLPPPRQLHADYSHRLHRNQVAQGHHNFVVGGAHGRYRDYGGTLIEVPEEVYAVRKAALTVLDPITHCWLILTIGFSTSVALGAAKWTSKLASLPYWIIFLPAWASHGGIVIMHIQSARALSKFISEANENRQRQDSTDHLDRVEYLPLLQRSLKFGLKTGVLCFVIFIFEVLLFIRLCNPTAITLAETFIPLWVLTVVFICNGIVCKSQHFFHSVIWVLVFTAMLLSVLRIDYDMVDTIQTRHIIIVIIAMFAIISGILIYIVHGHQIGYYKLTESQLTAGVFYSTSSFLAILLVAIMGDAVALPELIQLDLLVIIIILAPIVVGLAGSGAYLVTRDEFERLLKYGGQSAVMPMRLRLETDGWTSVVSRGGVTIPMFGDVKYEPLDVETAERLSIELWGPCCCYPTVEEDELPYFHRANNYQSPTPPNSMAVTARWGGSEAPIV